LERDLLLAFANYGPPFQLSNKKGGKTFVLCIKAGLLLFGTTDPKQQQGELESQVPFFLCLTCEPIRQRLQGCTKVRIKTKLGKDKGSKFCLKKRKNIKY
jgi:hypothetical protein